MTKANAEISNKSRAGRRDAVVEHVHFKRAVLDIRQHVTYTFFNSRDTIQTNIPQSMDRTRSIQVEILRVYYLLLTYYLYYYYILLLLRIL